MCIEEKVSGTRQNIGNESSEKTTDLKHLINVSELGFSGFVEVGRVLYNSDFKKRERLFAENKSVKAMWKARGQI